MNTTLAIGYYESESSSTRPQGCAEDTGTKTEGRRKQPCGGHRLVSNGRRGRETKTTRDKRERREEKIAREASELLTEISVDRLIENSKNRGGYAHGLSRRCEVMTTAESQHLRCNVLFVVWPGGKEFLAETKFKEP